MLEYSKIHENPPEVQDPVSGDFFPASFSDIKAKKEAEKSSEAQSEEDMNIISMLGSILK